MTLDTDAIMPSACAERSNPQVRESTAAAARATLLGGITTVRDCGGWDDIEMGVRDEGLAGR